MKHLLRQFARSPGSTAVIFLTLALGIGATTAIFSVVHAVLVRPMPFAAPDQLVWGWGRVGQSNFAAVSPPDFRDYRANQQNFSQLAAMIIFDGTANLGGGDRAEQIRTQTVSWNFFDALHLRPTLGRSFVAADEEGPFSRVAIISHDLWQRRFGGDPSVIDRTVMIDGNNLTIVGVLPDRPLLFSQAEVWQPMPMQAPWMSSRAPHFLVLVGRLKDGLSLAQGQAELDTLALRLAAQYPDTNTNWSINLVPLRDVVVGRVRSGS